MTPSRMYLQSKVYPSKHKAKYV